MVMINGRRRSPRLIAREGSETDSTILYSNDEISLTLKNDPRTANSYPSRSRRNLKQTAASEFDMDCQHSDYTFEDVSENDLASLAYTDSDDGTADFSDDCCACGSQSAEIRQRLGRKENEGSTNNYIDSYIDAKPLEHCEVGKYMASRVMTPFQERLNAFTVLPSTYYCIMFFLSGSWLSQSFIQDYANEMVDDHEFDESQCITSSWLPHLHALPPLPPVAAAVGILGHGPFSMIYHLKCAHALPPGLPRTKHWSRRMDQAMIHFQSVGMAYASTGRLDFFLANLLFNMDCFHRQFLPKVVPKRNQVRLGMSIFFYTLPILMRGEFMAYFQLGIIFGVGGWLFGQYPIGGWSHAVFHIAITFVPPVMFWSALNLPSSRGQLEVAAHCAMLAGKAFPS
mmetsp:Transcript_772/g.1767  ORF Transcript_772/g.1767 Transcript_772/m.1767 type:complete len:398 (-) Transcript_772:242-1435(-)